MLGIVNGEITKVGDLSTSANTYTPSPDSLFIDSTNNVAYITGSGNAIISVDISTLATPVLLDTFTGTGAPNYIGTPVCVYVLGNYAYVGAVAEDGFTIIDISNPSSMSYVGGFYDVGAPSATMEGVHAIEVYGTDAYVINNAGTEYFHIFDVSNPLSITRTGSVATTSTPQSLEVDLANNTAYIGHYIAVGTLSSIDFTNKASPSILQTLDTGDEIQEIVLDYPYLYVSHADVSNINIYDISNPSNMLLLTSISAGTIASLDINTNENVLSATYSGTTLETFDISSPASPVSLENITGAGSPNYLLYPLSQTIVGNYAYIWGDFDNRFVIFDISSSYPVTPAPTEPPITAPLPVLPAPISTPVPTPPPIHEPILIIIEEFITFISTSYNWIFILLAYLGALIPKITTKDETREILVDTALYGTIGWILVLILNIFIPIISTPELLSMSIFLLSGLILSILSTLNSESQKKKPRRKH